MNAKTKRLAHAYAVRELRRLGHELTSGAWVSRAPRAFANAGLVGTMSAPQAAVIIARAFGAVVDIGLATVRDAIDDRLAELLGARGDGD